MKYTFAAITELSFCCYDDFITPKRAIQTDLVISKQDLVKDKLFHLNEPFQLINNTTGIDTKLIFQLCTLQSCFISDPFLFQ